MELYHSLKQDTFRVTVQAVGQILPFEKLKTVFCGEILFLKSEVWGV